MATVGQVVGSVVEQMLGGLWVETCNYQYYRRHAGTMPGAIRISVGCPIGLERLPPVLALAPDWDWLRIPHAEYVKRMGARLMERDPVRCLAYLIDLVDPHPPVLLCYEPPGQFCHRRMVAEWLEWGNPGLVVPERGFPREKYPCWRDLDRRHK